MESSSAPVAVSDCVVINGVTTSTDRDADQESLHAEVTALRSELSKKHELLVKLQDRERQLRERSAMEILVPLFVGLMY